jgi:hypothetical protein
MRFVAKAYTILIVVLTLLAWSVDITMHDSLNPHLGPDILLHIVSLPASLSLALVYERWPKLRFQ